MRTLDASHDPGRRSRVASANHPSSDFSIQNLPFGIFSNAVDGNRRVGIAIGDQIVDLGRLADAGLIADSQATFRRPTLNDFIALGPVQWRETRQALSALLSQDGPALPDGLFVAQSDATMHLPLTIGGYTDFYSSLEHAEAGGRIMRGANATLVPHYRELPIAYNGRASSVVVSGSPIHRPLGQSRAEGEERPRLAPSAALDFELEMAFVVGGENGLGQSVPIDQAENHIFGMVLLNDWSARDHQRWESVPLGPFNAKGFATSISPWIVTLDALTPFRCSAPAQQPPPLAYLAPVDRRGFDITLEAGIRTAQSDASVTVTKTNHRYLYWTIAQQLAHHTIGGCNLRVGDLCGSGTISGPTPESAGSLLERTFNGTRPIMIAGDTTRGYLDDGDTVEFTGWCQGDGYRVGFGSCRGTILPVLNLAEIPTKMEKIS